ncbi:MAG: LacI family DNA-binding transcriptional regulator [Lachnospiraceae bacterium]|nr:LacI family DNA-binding transcriptional regulator [Lachnospiraceae bacterium]
MGEKKKHATIVDVARAAGVSPSTVSHVLNSTSSISDATKQQVMQAVRELQYIPNTTAKMLRKKRSNIIVLNTQDMTSEYYTLVYERLMECFQKSGYLPALFCGKWDEQQNAKNINTAIEYQAEGLISIGGVQKKELANAASLGIRVVLCDEYDKAFPCVDWNNFETMRGIVNAFCLEGKRRIVYIHASQHKKQDSTMKRIAGYRQGMLDNGLTPMDDFFILSDMESRYYTTNLHFDRLISHLSEMPRKNWPEVILCEHDAVANAVTFSLVTAGIRVPEDIQVMGFDDTASSVFSRPSLSTVWQQPKVLADAVFSMMKASLDGEDYPQHVTLSQSVVLRESTTIQPESLEKAGVIYRADNEG